MASRDAEKGQQGQLAKKKKSSLIKWIVMGLLLVVAAGGGGFAYTKYFDKSLPVGGAAKNLAPVMHPLDSFLVNLSDPGGKRYLKVSIELQLENLLTLNELKEKNHAVRDSILTLLSVKVYDDVASATGKMSLKREILTQLNRFLSQGQVKEVFFTDFLVQ